MIDLRPPCPISGFPTPICFKARAMPSQDGLRLHDLGYIEQTGAKSRDPYKKRPVTAVQPQTRRSPPQGNIELMTEKQVLGFEPASRLEHAGDEHSECVKDRKHQYKGCDDSASRRESAPDEIFGKDTSSPHVKLTGDFGNAIEVIQIGECFPFRVFAKNSSPCDFRLLQHNRHKADNSVAAAFVRFWTIANNGGFWPATDCPLMTRLRHGANWLEVRHTPREVLAIVPRSHESEARRFDCDERPNAFCHSRG